jgi:hypothetical protein
MAALSQEHGVEFAQVYRAGPGRNGGGGTYWLHSGEPRSVNVPIEPDVRLISHTHPGGTAVASPADMRVIRALGAAGSPQRSSQIILPSGETFRFGGPWTGSGAFAP